MIRVVDCWELGREPGPLLHIFVVLQHHLLGVFVCHTVKFEGVA